MTPLNFTVSLASATRPLSAAKAQPTEFVVEVAQDGFQGQVIQGLPEEKIIQARPVVIEGQPEVVRAESARSEQSPCQFTPPVAQEPPHEDGWFFHH